MKVNFPSDHTCAVYLRLNIDGVGEKFTYFFGWDRMASVLKLFKFFHNGQAYECLKHGEIYHNFLQNV